MVSVILAALPFHEQWMWDSIFFFFSVVVVFRNISKKETNIESNCSIQKIGEMESGQVHQEVLGILLELWSTGYVCHFVTHQKEIIISPK